MARRGVDWPIKAVMRRVMTGLSLRSETAELREAAQHSRIPFTALKEPHRLINASDLILSSHEVGLTDLCLFLQTHIHSHRHGH